MIAAGTPNLHIRQHLVHCRTVAPPAQRHILQTAVHAHLAARRCAAVRPQHLGRRSVCVRAERQQQEQEKPRVPSTPPGSGKRDQALAEDARDTAQQSLLSGLLSLWTYYNTGPAEQIVRRREPLPDSAADGIPLEDPEDDGPRWGIFDLKAYTQPWDVPWGGKETFGGMALWAATFLGTAFLLVPALYFKLGSKDSSDYGQLDWAYYAVGHQVLETVLSLAVIGFATRNYRPLSKDFFRVSLSNPFRKGDGWLVWALLGIVTAPAVIALVATALSAISYEEVGGKGTVDAVSHLISLNVPTYLSLMATTAVLAPILEETVFRGFLLTSLTKFMPTQLAVLTSALLFGAAHLSAKDFPQLVALGTVMGFSYVRSRNLLTPMLIHGTWNGAVLSLLFLLTSQGVNLEELLK